MIVAVDSAQNPPMVSPSKALAIISTAKFGADAMSSRDISMVAVSATSRMRRSIRAAMLGTHKLMSTAKRPEIEIACPAMPSVACKSRAMGVSKLTGMNSEAMSNATHMDIEPTALHTRSETLVSVGVSAAFSMAPLISRSPGWRCR